MESRLSDKGERMTSFVLDAETLNDFKAIISRERKTMKVMIEEFMKDYIKVHKDGNPQYTIDQFKDPNFVACPAVFRDGQTWNHYFSKISPQELERAKNQIILIDKALGKWI